MLMNTPICNFGFKAPDFTLSDPDGNQFTLSEHIGENGLLVMFICNHCPYVQAIADRLVEDVKELQAESISVLAVMPNDYRYVKIDSPPFMKRYAEEKGFTFPYLVDETQAVGKAYGAVCTPDFFGFNKHGELQYRGRIDDVGMRNSSHRDKELVNAMKQIAQTGEGPRQQTPSIGCSIKWS